MKKLFGTPGTVSGLMLRLGQCGSGAAAICVMVTTSGFSSYTAFCYLIASMGLQVLWSLGLAWLDISALRKKRELVTATLSLAAASSSSGIVILFARDLNFCKVQSFPHAQNIKFPWLWLL